MSKAEPRPMRVVLKSVERVYPGYFKIDKLTTEHERYRADGKPGEMIPFVWEVFQRGDAVAVVLYNVDRKALVLVRQFRAPTLKYRKIGDSFELSNDGYLDETIAGMPQEKETNIDCAIREVREETGYRINASKLEPIAQFYASPGGTSERIFLYFAQVKDTDRVVKSDMGEHGVLTDGESINVRHVPISEFFSEVIDPKVTLDSKALIASLWLRERLFKNPDNSDQIAPESRRRYVLKSNPNFSVVLRTGNMLSVTDVDAWINSEVTDMEMDRFSGNTVSAVIRREGAVRDEQGRVVRDVIADALKRAMGQRASSHLGTVHNTEPGELAKKNVKRIFHVAAVAHLPAGGARIDVGSLQEITLKALQAVEKRNSAIGRSRCGSAMLPVIGGGEGMVASQLALPKIIEGILDYFKQAPRKATLTAVHLNAYRLHDAEVAASILDGHPALDYQS